MFSLRFFGGKSKDPSDDASRLNSPPPPVLDLAALRQQDQLRAKQTQEALARGQLPPNVVERLQSERAGNLPWTSDLSVQEWASLRQYRLKPLGQVMGSAFYHIGYIPNPGMNWYPSSQELRPPTQAMYQSRHLAMERLRQEAMLLGANAVVGVHLEHKGFQTEAGMMEYAAFGTAVYIEDLGQRSQPLLCTVSGQDFARLTAAGAIPVGLALGASFYYLYTDWWDMRQENSWYNQEMQHFVRGVAEARRLATRRMREDVTQSGGDGVIGTDMHLHVEEIGGGRSTDEGEAIIDHVIEVFMLGTVIAYERRVVPEQLQASAVLDLRV
ncbi:MAG: heavy metal-binding domain-containing protein [Firmicutes bacterium]|nr:heavy metal-binding domain-containing protein [Bacillota bacterium]